eukprot:5320827-Amphidinium_carterae.1
MGVDAMISRIKTLKPKLADKDKLVELEVHRTPLILLTDYESAHRPPSGAGHRSELCCFGCCGGKCVASVMCSVALERHDLFTPGVIGLQSYKVLKRSSIVSRVQSTQHCGVVFAWMFNGLVPNKILNPTVMNDQKCRYRSDCLDSMATRGNKNIFCAWETDISLRHMEHIWQFNTKIPDTWLKES